MPSNAFIKAELVRRGGLRDQLFRLLETAGRRAPVARPARRRCARPGLAVIGTAAFQGAFETAQRTIFFELAWSYLPNIAAGEDIGIVTAPEPWPGPDFWMFDDQRLWLMHYDETGALERVEDASAATTTPPRVLNGCIGGCA